MTLLSMPLLPQNRRRGLPLHIQRLARQRVQTSTAESLVIWIKMESWIDLIPLVRSISVHRPSGWLCAMFDGEVLIWPMSRRDRNIFIVSTKDFRYRLQSKLRQPIPIAINQNYVLRSFHKEVGWSSEYLQWRSDGMNLEQR